MLWWGLFEIKYVFDFLFFFLRLACWRAFPRWYDPEIILLLLYNINISVIINYIYIYIIPIIDINIIIIINSISTTNITTLTHTTGGYHRCGGGRNPILNHIFREIYKNPGLFNCICRIYWILKACYRGIKNIGSYKRA